MGMLREYVIGGVFSTHLRKIDWFDNKVSMFYSLQVALIFEYCYLKNYVYCDLKLESLLTNADRYVKLIDFTVAEAIHHRMHMLCDTTE